MLGNNLLNAAFYRYCCGNDFSTDMTVESLFFRKLSVHPF